MEPTVTPLAGALGARVDGLDLAMPPQPATIELVGSLLAEHLVLIFPDQKLTDDQHLAFVSAFGSPYVHPLGRVAGRTEGGVEHIVDDADHPPYQDVWHTDVSWDPTPPVIGSLRAVEMPSPGGDTVWASMYAAYEALSLILRQRLDGLVALHDMGRMSAFVSKAGEELTRRTQAQFPGAEHPVVAVHPVTGRRYLYVNVEFTRRIVGMTDQESDALLQLLTAQATNANHQYRHRWTVGEVALWDERATQHFAVADYFPKRREMARATVV